MKRVILLMTAILLFTTFCVEAVMADVDCTYRPPNAGEKAFYSHISVLQAAVPPAPEDWALRDDEKLKPQYSVMPAQVCMEESHLDLSLQLYYERRSDAAKEDATLHRAVNAAPDKAQQDRIKPLQAKQMALAKQAADAAGRGEYEKIDKLNAEMDALAEKIKKMTDAMYAPQAQINAELQRDHSASIYIVVNGSGGDCNGNPQPINIPGALAYRCAYDDGYTSSGEVLDHASARILIVFGQAFAKKQDWRRFGRDQREFTDQMLSIGAAYDKDLPLVIQNVVIRIDGDNPNRVDSLYRGLRLEGLKKLVKR
jgi:hypothetical protein